MRVIASLLLIGMAASLGLVGGCSKKEAGSHSASKRTSDSMAGDKARESDEKSGRESKDAFPDVHVAAPAGADFAKVAIAGKKEKAPPAPEIAAAVADPVAGTAKKAAKPKDQLPSGILTAGSFDDNVDPLVFRSFVAKMGQLRTLGDLPTKLDGQRLVVLVKDAAGKPVGNARVKVLGGASAGIEVVTRSDGRAVFVHSLDQLPAGQPLVATATLGRNTATETIAAGSARWEITLPGVEAALPKILDLAIVLDTTGSMGDEIRHLQAEFRGIAAALAKKFPEVQQRYALVLYRDDGDDYVTRVFDFTPSVDEFHKRLAAQSAGGGGDYPEAMHRGLEEANQLRWRDADAARVLFLVGDAPPHAQHMKRTLAAVNNLRQRGVAVYPVACSGYDDSCEFVMRSAALVTGSQFLFLTDDSGVGNSHAEPKIPYYQVERLERLMIRMIASELAGRRIEADSQEVIRAVGRKMDN